MILHKKAVWLGLMSVCCACLASAPVSDEVPSESSASEVRVVDERLAVLNSRIDAENRYLSAVLVNGVSGVCSGVLIHPRLVLTAGHCVCVEREDEDKRIIDGAHCGGTAMVKTIVYPLMRQDGGPAREPAPTYSGQVRPHPDLNLVFDGRGRLVSFKTDLAVIVLNGQTREIRTSQLADAEVKVGDSIVMVGYGYSENTGGEYGQRRFGRNEVAAVGSGLFQARKPGSHFLEGDSGGPCFRETPQGAVLVGVMMSSAIRASSSSTFTSTFVHQKWLREQIQLADEEAVSGARQTP